MVGVVDRVRTSYQRSVGWSPDGPTPTVWLVHARAPTGLTVGTNGRSSEPKPGYRPFGHFILRVWANISGCAASLPSNKDSGPIPWSGGSR
jgi:hypothetical protein